VGLPHHSPVHHRRDTLQLGVWVGRDDFSGDPGELATLFLNFMAEESNEERKVNLNLLDEIREEARIKAEALKRRVEYNYISKLKPRQFQVADLVMRKAHPYQLENKLSPKWTGPFRVTEALGNGAYRLETQEGGAIPLTWNATNLKFYFS